MKKKFVNKITPRNEDFARWYTDVVTKTNLVKYSGVKGAVILEPYGCSLWEKIQNYLNKRFSETGHSNVYMPSLIEKSALAKEKSHISGFAPEVFWVTHSGEKELMEPLCLRPTSEAQFSTYFSTKVKSYNDLPVLLNQWCNVFRCEKNTRPFLRTSEFLWQEGHTVHETEEEALLEVHKIIKIYEDLCRDLLAFPVLIGQKTEKEKFAGGVSTFTLESLMYDGKTLQTATSHYLGDNFAKAFDIKYSDRNNNLKHVVQTSWGITTRAIGALIMIHGDDEGLVLPPMIAPIQIVIIPIIRKKSTEDDEKVQKFTMKIYEILKNKFSVKLDDSDKGIGFKFSEYEMIGVPLRIEIGLKEVQSDEVSIVRRDNRQKFTLILDNLKEETSKILNAMQKEIYNNALTRLNSNIHIATSYSEFKEMLRLGGFIISPWCGDVKCEDAIKEETTATSRCIKCDSVEKKCIYCGKESRFDVYWGLAY